MLIIVCSWETIRNGSPSNERNYISKSSGFGSRAVVTLVALAIGVGVVAWCDAEGR